MLHLSTGCVCNHAWKGIIDGRNLYLIEGPHFPLCYQPLNQIYKIKNLNFSVIVCNTGSVLQSLVTWSQMHMNMILKCIEESVAEIILILM